MIAAGDRLRDLREDKGKTQAEISSLLGTTQQIYSRYETNQDGSASSASDKTGGLLPSQRRLYSRSNLLPEESARNGETIS